MGQPAGQEEVDRLLAKAEAAEEEWERIALLGQAATLVEEVDPRAAERLWRKALVIDSLNEEAWLALERIYERTGQWHNVAAVLEVRVNHSSDVKEVVALRCRLASLHENELEDPAKAIELWRAVLDLEPQNAAAHASLEPLLQGAQSWTQLADLYELRLDLEADPAERRRIGERLCAIYADVMEDPERAQRVRDRLG